MVGFVEGEDAGFELLGGFECSEHGIQDLVVERLSDVEFDDLFGLLLGFDELEVFEFAVVDEIFPLFFDFAVLLTHQQHEVDKCDLFVVGIDFDGAV